MKRLEELIRDRSKNIQWEFSYKESYIICTATAFGVTTKYSAWLRGAHVNHIVEDVLFAVTRQLIDLLFYKEQP